MRIIHTADWHLGRIFHGIHLTEDQAHVLDRFIDLVKDAKPDAVLVSGDIYDRAVPPPEAVSLLDDVLSRLCLDCGVPVVVIAGNHDSPDRLGFGSRLLATQKLHMLGSMVPPIKPITLEDKYGPILLHALPYAEPSVVREKLSREDVTDHDSAMRALTEGTSPRSGRSVLMAHAFVPGCTESDSERPLTVGGTGTVDAACFEGFSYVALGHLHCPQETSADRIHYSGSLLKYSFAEAQHRKSVNLVEIDGNRACAVERIPLSPKRDVRCMEGKIEKLLDGNKSDDYLSITLLDREPILDAMGKLREVYPNVLHIDRPFLTPSGDVHGGADHRKMGDTELFAAFFSQVTGDELTVPENKAFSDVVDALRKRDREAAL